MSGPVFDKATPSDWEAIRSLLAASKLPLDGARDHLHAFTVARDETGLLACGGLEVYGPVALLRSVAVAQRRQGQGLGKDVLAKLFANARLDGVATLVLLTDTAEPYFGRLGFKSVPRTSLPEAVMASAEFRGACPASSTAMTLALDTPAK